MTAQVDFQPAITRWGHTWRIVLVLFISVVTLGGVNENGGLGGRTTLLVVDLAAGLVGFVAMFFRRRHPLATAVATSLLTVVSATAGGPAALAMTSLATRRSLRPLATAAALNVVASAVYIIAVRRNVTEPVQDLVGIFVPLIAVVGWGLFVGSRRELLWNLRQRAEQAEADQELRAKEARANERTRIAREMHDVVAHRISQVSMRAGALAYRTDLSADEMRAQNELIRDTANEALRELRSVLHVLRDPSTGAPIEQPQPTHTDIVTLVEDARHSGARINFEQMVDRAIPTEIGRTLYRIVQEGITNASKHAPGAVLAIALVEDEDGVVLTLTNAIGFGEGTTPGSALGLVGIAERIAVAGGHFDHAKRDGHFTLRAWLPCAP